MTPTEASAANVCAVFPGWLDLASRVSRRTLAEYRYDATRYLAFCAEMDLTPLDADALRTWRNHMVDASGLSPNTMNRRLATVKRLAKASAILKRLPAATAHEFALVENAQLAPLRHRLRADARVKLTPADVRALVDAPNPRLLLGRRDRALLATLAGSGCRIGEAVQLQTDHILRVAGGFMIEVLGKGQAKPRLAPLSLEAHDAIARWLRDRARHVDAPHLFTGFKGPRGKESPVARPLSAWAGWHVVRKYAEQAGLPQVKPHDFRRFVGTQLAKKDLRAAQLALGHKRLETTARHYVLDELEPGLTDGLY
jgi:integrase/recombinase XerD